MQAGIKAIAVVGGFDQLMLGYQIECLTQTEDQGSQILAGRIGLGNFLRPDLFCDFHCGHGGLLTQQHICQQTAGFGGFHIALPENTGGGVDLQITKEVDDNVGVVFDLIRREGHLHALHQLLLVYRRQHNEGQELKHTAAVDIPLGITDYKEAGGSGLHRDGENGLGHQALIHRIFARVFLSDILRVGKNDGFIVLHGGNPAVQELSRFKFLQKLQGSVRRAGEIPMGRRP